MSEQLLRTIERTVKAERSKENERMTLPETMTENGITYRLDAKTETHLPDWELPEQKPIGKYGLMRLDFLKKHRKATYQAMLLKGTLNAHLSETDETANRRLDEMMPRLAKTRMSLGSFPMHRTDAVQTKNFRKSAGVTEQLKAENQMKWVGLMNTLKA